MLCCKCGNPSDEGERFCRRCGTLIGSSGFTAKTSARHLSYPRPKDPDELIGNGIGSVFVGDGFLMVAAFLSVTNSPISGLLWLLLLIPAFFFFGKGFADVFHAQQIRRRMNFEALEASPSARGSISGELALPSITEKTTRNLK